MVQVNTTGEVVLWGVGVWLWLLGAYILSYRSGLALRRYLRRLPPIDGHTVSFTPFGAMFSSGPQLIRRALRLPVTDPELRRLRQALRRRDWHFVLWLCGVPVVVIGAMVVLTQAHLLVWTR